MIAAAVALALLRGRDQSQVEWVRAFPGGTFDEYCLFVATSRLDPSGIVVWPSRLTEGMGPSRVLHYENQRVAMEPPLGPLLAIKGTDTFGYLQPSRLPFPYLQFRPMSFKPAPSQEDVVRSIKFAMTPTEAPDIDATLRLGNGLKPLGMSVQVHPFFDDMWVTIRHSGSPSAKLLEAVSKCVGGKLSKGTGKSPTYRIEPDPEEIRRRALATMEYHFPRRDPGSTLLRDRIWYRMLKDCSPAVMRRWIDGSIKEDIVPIEEVDIAPLIRDYRDLFFQELQKGGASLPAEAAELRAMPMFLSLGSHLQFGILLKQANGTYIHI